MKGQERKTMQKLECFESAAAATVEESTAIKADDPPFGSGPVGQFSRVFVLPGDRVTHDLWGSGTVISARGLGALVEFDYLGQRVFVSASALETA
jgi:hypothetical protein